MNGNGLHSTHAGFVPGYVPISISKSVQEQLRAFRREKLPVDLRIERAMVTAATELCFQDRGMLNELQRRAESLIEERGSEPTASVLIRREVKRDLRTTAQAWGIHGADDKVNEALVSAAVSLALTDESSHAKWVELVADAVAWEVRKGFEWARKTD